MKSLLKIKLKSMFLGATIGISTCATWALTTQEKAEFISAVKNNNLVFVNSLLPKIKSEEIVEIMMTQQDDVDDTLLHLCVERDYVDCVKVLLNNINIILRREITKIMSRKNKAGDIPLHKVASEDMLNVLRKKLTYKERVAFISLKNKAGNTPFHLALSKGNLDFVKSFLTDLDKQDIFKIIMQPNETGDSPFLLAIKNKNQELAKVLFGMNQAPFSKLLSTNQAFEIIMRTDEFGNTPLHNAVKSNDLETVNGLLKDLTKDDAIVIMKIRNNDGNTPLHLAVSDKNTDLVTLLLDKPNKQDISEIIMQSNKSGDSPFLLAIRSKNPKLVGVLFSKLTTQMAFEIIMRTDEFGNTPLHNAVKSNDLETVNGLLKDLTKDDAIVIMKIRNNDGNTPLHLAAKNGYIDIVNVLLKKLGKNAAEVIKIRDVFGYVVLHWAIQNKNVKITIEINECEYDKIINELDCRDIQERKIITQKDKIEIIVKEKYLKKLEDLLKIFPKEKVRVEKQDSVILNAFLEKLTNEDVIELNQTPNIEMFDYLFAKFDNYQSIFHFVAGGSADCLEKLISKLGSDTVKEAISQKIGFAKITPLHVAALNGNASFIDKVFSSCFTYGDKEIAKFMKEEDKEGRTVLDYVITTAKTKEELAIKVAREFLIHAIKIDENEIVENLLKNLPENRICDAITQKDYRNGTMLHVAVRKSNVKIVNLLLDYLSRLKGDKVVKDTIKETNFYKNTVLHEAINEGNVEIVNRLFSFFSKDEIKNLINQRGYHGNTLFHVGLGGEGKSNIDIVRKLFEYFSKDNIVLNAEGETLLHSAVKGRNVEIVKILFSHLTKDEIKKMIKTGSYCNEMTPLHLSVMVDKKDDIRIKIEIVEILFSYLTEAEIKKLINKSNDFKRTPRSLARGEMLDFLNSKVPEKTLEESSKK